MNKGILYGLGAYFIWGVFPIYWKLVEVTPPTQILGHRIVWSFLLLAVIISWRCQWATLQTAVARPRTLGIYTLAACLLAVNWLAYIWGVNAGYIVETSLGYFINPLVNVLLGVVFLRERLRSLQWIAVGLAFLGVLYLTIQYGQPPWLALLLAFTFGFYGLMKKTSPLASLPSLTLETGILFIPAAFYLVYVEISGVGALGHSGTMVDLLLLGAGIATTVPLLLFGAAARRIDLSMMGVLQYVAPTCQFLIGVLLYREPFEYAQLVGFCLIWLALAIFWIEGIYWRRRQR
jgi:chloramphenicol-sensitive protein RarD